MSHLLLWWELTGDAAGVQAWRRYQDLACADEDRCRHYIDCLRQYMNRDLQDYSQSLYRVNRRENRSLNLTKSVVDAIATKVAKLKPKATFVTKAGDASLRRKARNLDRYVEGQYRRLGVYDKIERLVKDAEIYGTGVWHVYTQDGDIRLESVYPGELVVDPRESLYREPRELFRRMRVNREVLKAHFPDRRDAIESAAHAQGYNYASPELDLSDDADLASCMLDVVAGWHLPSSADAGDGRYIVMLEDVVLEESDYRHDRFPFLFFHWDEPPLGFWGSGVVEQVRSIDTHVNEMLDRIEIAQRVGSVPMAFIEQGAFVGGVEMMNNHVMNLYELKPGKGRPEFVVPPTIGGDYLNHLERRIQQAFETTGVSQLSAQSQKPSGLDAAVALREMVDIESERFILPARRLETLVGIRLAEDVVTLSKEIAETGDHDALTVRMVDGRNAVEVKWRDVDLDRDAYVLQVFPTSSLPQQPAARQARVQELLQAGMVTAEEGRELMEMPDLEAFNDRRLAPQRLVERILENILEDGPYIGPEPYFPLKMALGRFQEAYMAGVVDNVSEEKLEALRRWMLVAEKMLMPAAPLPGAAPPGMEAGVAGPQGPAGVTPPEATFEAALAGAPALG